MDPARRAALKIEARRNRIQWVEEGRRVAEDQLKLETCKIINRSCAELATILPCALDLYDFLGELSGDTLGSVVEDPEQKYSSILLPFALCDTDDSLIADDLPLPSHQPGRSSYDVLLLKLKHPIASEIVNTLEQFVVRFTDQGVLICHDKPISHTSKLAHIAKIPAFLKRTGSIMREHILWRDETDEQWDQTSESLERLIMYKLYDITFKLTSDYERDAAIFSRLKSLELIEFKHLEKRFVPSTNRTAPVTTAELNWMKPRNLLLKMTTSKCPSDKLSYILDCINSTMDILSNDQIASTDAGPGADELLPALIDLIKSSCPPHIYSNLEYIHMYTSQEKLNSGKGSYALTQIASALHFLENADASQLSLDHEEFEMLLSESRKAAEMDIQQKQTADVHALGTPKDELKDCVQRKEILIRSVSSMRRGNTAKSKDIQQILPKEHLRFRKNISFANIKA